MTGMRSAPALSRTSESTRRSIVGAAARLMRESGRPASLDRIAAAAGVSKGGLLYHFASQDELALAICEDSIERIWSGVRALVDEEDERPGRFLRAYVRALLGESAEAASALLHSGSLQLFADIDAVRDLLCADADRWRDAFDRDGIERSRWLSIRFAVEGMATCVSTPYLTEEELSEARRSLLGLSTVDGEIRH